MTDIIKELQKLEEKKQEHLIEVDGELFVKNKVQLDIISSQIAAKLPEILDALEDAQRRAKAGENLRKRVEEVTRWLELPESARIGKAAPELRKDLATYDKAVNKK